MKHPCATKIHIKESILRVEIHSVLTIQRDENGVDFEFDVGCTIVQTLNLYTFVKWNIKKYPNENAFLFKEEVLTWKEASDKIDSYSGVIRSLGLNKGDSFALLMDNRIEYLLLIL